MDNIIFFVKHNIESLEEIVDQVPVGTTIIACNNKGLKSLRGIERLPNITRLFVINNQITSLEGLAGSNVAELYISNNQVTSLEGLCGSNVTMLSIHDNPCHQQFYQEFEGSVKKAVNYYNQFIDTPKDPGYD